MYQCHEVSFPDARIRRFSRTEEELGDGVLIVSDWQAIEVKLFDSDLEEWRSVVDLRPFELGRLCEVERVSNETLELRGFASEAGWWTVWSFANPQCRICRDRSSED